MTKIIVMLIWMGATQQGGPAVLPGFHSMAACRTAEPIVAEGLNAKKWISAPVTTNCVELDP